MTLGSDNSTRYPSTKKIVVVGDLILDSFVEGAVHRISPEAPVPVLLPKTELDLPGGAANVAANIEALGGHAILFGVTGEDAAGDRLLRCIAKLPWRDTPEILRSDRWQTPHKTRYCADGQHMLRVDREMWQGQQDDISTETRLRALYEAVAPIAGLAVISDYRKGTLSDAACRSVVDVFRARNVPVLVDSKAEDFGVFAGAALVTPNLAELALAARQPLATQVDAVRAARLLMSRYGIGAMVVTMAADGMLVVDEFRDLHVPSAGHQLSDVTGAGDTVMAGLAVALAEGSTLSEAAQFASAAAGVAVKQRGTTVVRRREVLDRDMEVGDAGLGSSGNILELQSLCQKVATWRSRGLRIGFTNGCFDIVHAGHLRLIADAAARCDKLIVAVNTDESVRRLKGPSRPVQPEEVRLKVISGLRGVAAIIAFAEETPIELIEALKPDVLVKGADYELGEIIGANETLARGGDVVRVPLLEGCSTTTSVELLRRGKATD